MLFIIFEKSDYHHLFPGSVKPRIRRARAISLDIIVTLLQCWAAQFDC
jgi:hypothetical protein